MPNAQLVWVEECGHVPHLEQPDETARAIVDFVKNGSPAKVRRISSIITLRALAYLAVGTVLARMQRQYRVMTVLYHALQLSE